MPRIAICDDLQEDRIRLKRDIEVYFSGKEDVTVLGYESGDELVDVMGRRDFDIVFMDVYMNGISGVEASRRIRKLGKDCAIIFTTTSPDHAMAGYEVKASDYLLKPYRQEEVFESLDYALNSIEKAGNCVALRTGGKEIRIPTGEIISVKATENGCTLECTGNRTVSENRSFAEVSALLDESFLKNQEEGLVNAAFVERVSGTDVQLAGGGSLPLKAALAETFRKEFTAWVFRRTWEQEKKT